MPSRKKAKGKARKAAKLAKAKAKAEEEESEPVVEVAASQRQDESLDAQMQRLVIEDVTPQNCRHGLLQLSTDEKKRCLEFIDAFLASFHSEDDDVVKALLTAYDATKVKYTDVYNSKLEAVITIFLSYGTQYVLQEDNTTTRMYASLASFFDEFMDVYLRKTKATVSCTKTVELLSADDHTLVSYYRKRIPCSCLDKKYKEVKSVKKMGLCYNPNCSHPGGRVERSKMFYCTRCGDANYCSVECQRVDWKEHSSEECDNAVKAMAAFNSQKS